MSNIDKFYDIKQIKDVLISIGIDKVYILEDLSNCILVLCVYGGCRFLILISRGVYSWYSKIILADDVLETYWKCKHLIFVSGGFYIFDKDISILINKIKTVLSNYCKLINSKLGSKS